MPNVDALPEIDFFAIAEKTNLKIDADVCENIRYILAEYISLVRVWEDKPLSKQRKASLRAVEKACELLESIFELDACGTQEEFDSLQSFTWRSVTPHVECFLENDDRGFQYLVVKEKKIFDFSDRGQFPFDGKNVADYLVLCRERIQQTLNYPQRSGNREKYAITRCLNGFHQEYIFAGGKGRGCWRAADGNYCGSFLVFSKELLDYTDYSFSESALANQIIKNIEK